MALPTDRASLKQYCLQALGEPVITINVPDAQLDDRIDEALQWYADYHWDGSFKEYYKHQLTDTDIVNGYIEIPDETLGVFDIFDLGTAISSAGGMFSINYQIALNDLYTYVSADIVPYWQTIENLQFLDALLVGKQPLRYNRHMQKLYIDMDQHKLTSGQFIIAKTYVSVNPDDYPTVWQDRWLMKYATALIKRQWGRNLTKFVQAPLPGGMMLNGDAIHQEAEFECSELEKEIINKSVITAFEIG